MKRRTLSCLAFLLFLVTVLATARVCGAQTPAPAATVDPNIEAKAREWLHRFQSGKIDPTQLTALVKTQMTPEVLQRITSAIALLGDPLAFSFTSRSTTQGITVYTFLVTFKDRKMNEVLALDSAGKIAGISFNPEQTVADFEKLTRLKGRWRCAIRNGSRTFPDVAAEYSLSQDGVWMTELTYDSMTATAPSETQMWGYDSAEQKIVAYMFTKNGVYTKTVVGWIGNNFVSSVDQNDYIVSLVPIDANNMQWVLEDAKHSFRATESCTRTNYSAASP